MTLNYINLSSGYIGKECNFSTLNSQYYAELFKKISTSNDILTKICTFPQRVPRADFFKELHRLETNDFKQEFENLTSEIAKNYRESASQLWEENSEENIRTHINWFNICLRYCLFDEVKNYNYENYKGPYSLEIEMLFDTTNIEISLSSNTPISIKKSLELVDKYIEDTQTTLREKIILLNQIVVNFYRHQNKINIQIFSLAKLLLKFIQIFEQDDFLSRLYSSVVYRGLAMVKEFGRKKQHILLEKAEILARALNGQTIIEKIIEKENLYTCLQTMSKWNLLNKSFTNAEHYLNEMTIIDPTDSTGYSELAFLNLKKENYEIASDYFKKALELGPPNPGMNAYYYAKCQEKIGNQLQFIDYLYKTTELDNHAISPWLDLLEYFNKQKDNEKAAQIASKIYFTPILKEQLEENEIKFIKSIIC